MVSQRQGAILAAAATEFAARGFDGARMDRIAGRARVNKALVYYYCGSKARLYGEVLHDLFGAVAAAVAAVRAAGGPPADQLRGFIRAVAAEAAARPHVPAIWLREMADGGRHVGAPIMADVRRVVDTLAAILAEGRQRGAFGERHPFLTHLSIVAPLMLFLASAPARTRLARHLPASMRRLQTAAMLEHLETSTIAALAPRSATNKSRREPRSPINKSRRKPRSPK
jgi:TetR/AcrR family transcriptional regulator